MTFNDTFSFDFDPSNGITGGTTDFQSVAIHEVGHAMGFVSGVDFRSADIELLDVYRFQRTTNNPATTGDFQSLARLVDFNNPDDDHNSDIISAEHRMSDGSPSQASHFREGLNGIMDPTLAAGQTFFPNFFRTADKDMFDAIGWDFPAVPSDLVPPQPDPMTFSSTPAPLSTSSITMTATVATDDTNPVQYYFEEATGNPGSTTSGWQNPNSFVDSDLDANTAYTYRVKVRDNVMPTPNETLFSADASVATLIQTPGPPATSNTTTTSVDLVATGTLTNLGVGMSGVFFESLTPGGNGGIQVWQQTTTASVTGLVPNTTYFFHVKARNQDGVETPFSSVVDVTTIPIFGDCNNDFVVDVEGDLPCYVDSLLEIDNPPGSIDRSDVNFDGFTDALDIPEMINCLVFGCN
jgi:hypothetical protein